MNATCPSPATIPIRPGSIEEFATVRNYLKETGFTETNVRARVECKATLLELLDKPDVSVSDTLWLLIKVFLQRRKVALSETEGHIPEKVLAAFLSMGLLSRDPEGGLYAPVLLTPTPSGYYVADGGVEPGGKMLDDAVYPPSSPPTQTFLHFLPRDRCRRLLEIGTGSGVCSILAAREYADEVWASDLTERSVEFAEFNRVFNGVGNLTVLQGDLYGAVGGMTFDRIIAHPPYVPVLRKKYVFYDGGRDGEEITKRIFQGLTEHLEPGGRCYCKALGSDRDLPFEQRIREWLGTASEDFDIVVAQWDEIPPAQLFARLSLGSARAEEDFDSWQQFCQEIRIRSFLNCMIVAQRRPTERPVFTARRFISARSNPESLLWLLNWETIATERDPGALVLTSKPRIADGVELTLKRRWEKDAWLPVESRIKTEYPFALDAVMDEWMPSLLEYCTGQATTEEIFLRASADKLFPAATTKAAFSDLMAALVRRGFLETEEFSLPAATG